MAIRCFFVGSGVSENPRAHPNDLRSVDNPSETCYNKSVHSTNFN